MNIIFCCKAAVCSIMLLFIFNLLCSGDRMFRLYMVSLDLINLCIIPCLGMGDYYNVSCIREGIVIEYCVEQL